MDRLMPIVGETSKLWIAEIPLLKLRAEFFDGSEGRFLAAPRKNLHWKISVLTLREIIEWE
jgi:hypothetical protein